MTEGRDGTKLKAKHSVQSVLVLFISHIDTLPHTPNPLLIYLPACFDHQSGARCVFIGDFTENEYEVQSGKHVTGETFPLRNEPVLCLFMRIVVCRDCQIL